MAFTGWSFGEMLAQGLAQGQAAKSRRDELTFRKAVQDFNQRFAVDEAARQQGNIEEARDIQQSQYATSLASENAFRGAQIGIQNRNADLNENQFDLLKSRYLPFETQYGTANIDVRDLLGYWSDQARIRLQREGLNRQTAPIDVGGVRSALEAVVTGQDLPRGTTIDYRTAPAFNEFLKVGASPLARMQYDEGVRQMKGLQQTREVLGRAQDRAQFDLSQVAPQRPIGLERFVLGSDLAAGVGGAGIPGISHYAAKAYADVGGQEARYQERIGGTESYLKNVVSQQAKTLSEIQGIKDPEIRAQAAAAVAPQMSKFIGDVQASVQSSGVSPKAKRELNTALVKLGGYYLSNMPSGDPISNQLQVAFNQAVEDGDTERIVDLTKTIADYQSVGVRRAQFEQRAARDRYEQITGQ